MKKFFKWAGIIIGVVLVLIVIVLFYFNQKGKSMISQTFAVNAYDIVLPDDSASLARGEYFVNALCRHCHGSDLGGMAILDDPKIGFLASPNITSGTGGLTSEYTTADWIRSIRHGIAPDGRGLMIMPSNSFNHFTSQDLASVIAYLKMVPAVNKEWPERNFPFLSATMAGLGLFGDLIPAELIDHDAPYTQPVQEAETIEYGKYMFDVSGCVDCHKSNLAGGSSPEPGAPPVPNISKLGRIGKWTPEQFVATMKMGKTPEGKLLDAKFMPWTGYAIYTESDLKAVYAFLLSQPGVEVED